MPPRAPLTAVWHVGALFDRAVVVSAHAYKNGDELPLHPRRALTVMETHEGSNLLGRRRFLLKYYFAARRVFEVSDGAPACNGVCTDGVGAGKKALQYTAVLNTTGVGEAACWAPPQELWGSTPGPPTVAAGVPGRSGGWLRLISGGGRTGGPWRIPRSPVCVFAWYTLRPSRAVAYTTVLLWYTLRPPS